MELMLYVEYVTFALCSLTLAECWYVLHDVEWGLYIKIISVCKMGLTGLTTPTVRSICTFAVFFSVSLPFCCFTLVHVGHFVLCHKEKIEPLACAIANFKTSSVCVISTVICMLLR